MAAILTRQLIKQVSMILKEYFKINNYPRDSERFRSILNYILLYLGSLKMGLTNDYLSINTNNYPM